MAPQARTAAYLVTMIGTLVLVACDVVVDPAAEGCNGSAARLEPGKVTALAGASACVTGAAGAQYALVAFNAADERSPTSAFTVTAANITPITGVLVDRQHLETSTPVLAAPPRRDDAFHGRLRERESALMSRAPEARSWLGQRRSAAGRDAAAAAREVDPIVGATVSLNTNTDEPCLAPVLRSGQVVAVGSRSIVVADSENPAGGFTPAEYQALAAQFDTLIDPLVTAIFGTATDIDDNDRVVLFYTRAVNQLTPSGSDFFVGGFFFARDLLPVTGNADFGSCAGSNAGEMFYLMVPDPGGVVNGNVFTKSKVTSENAALLVHEYQHLVNASRRLYVNTTAAEFEETWLNEGLSHSAEELLFYRQTGLSPRRNIGPQTLSASSAAAQAFNSTVAGNFASLIDFLENPERNSPYADNDSLATRGATWSFLRYAVDRRGSSDGDVWFQLTNSVTAGMATLRRVLGPDVDGWVRDWATALAADDLPGAEAASQHASWQYRALITAVHPSRSYPLKLTSLTPDVPATLTVVAGGVSYLPFQTGSSAATLNWTAAPSMVFTLVRLK